VKIQFFIYFSFCNNSVPVMAILCNQSPASNVHFLSEGIPKGASQVFSIYKKKINLFTVYIIHLSLLFMLGATDGLYCIL
jgi:hypothetical protein